MGAYIISESRHVSFRIARKATNEDHFHALEKLKIAREGISSCRSSSSSSSSTISIIHTMSCV